MSTMCLLLLLAHCLRSLSFATKYEHADFVDACDVHVIDQIQNSEREKSMTEWILDLIEAIYSMRNSNAHTHTHSAKFNASM